MQELFKTLIILFAVIDPIGTIPVFLEATKTFDQVTKKRVAIKAACLAFAILLFFIVTGQIIMEAMHISLAAFRVSGGVVLFIFSLTMVFGEGKPEEEKHMIKDHQHVVVFPLAIPSIASPGAVLAVVLLTDNHVYTVWQQFLTTLVVLLVVACTALLLLGARSIQDRVGETGITVISKVMGLILASVAVESILQGLKLYFNL